MKVLSKYSVSLLIKSAASLLYWHFIIKVRRFQSWRSRLTQFADEQSHQPPQPTPIINHSVQQQAAQIKIAQRVQAHISAIVRNSPIEFNCMRRCLALKHILNKQAIYPKFHIGVKLNNEKALHAHSWLSLHGKIINDSESNLNSYTELTVSEQWGQYINVM